MLRVTTLYAASAVATAAYYTRYLADAAGEAPGRWCGRQAADLGLSGRVEADELQRLLEGRDPAIGAVLGRPLVDRPSSPSGTVVRAVAGFDATFSAPKSVSVWWALSGDRGVLDAHELAVRAALEHLERFGATTRIRHGGGRLHVDTGGLTMATFRQTTSRADDPQLHTHVVISAKVPTDDGRWLALDARYLKRHQRVLGGLYQSVLRAELTHRYGVSWGPIVNGQAELTGAPTELLARFSKRTEQVDAALAVKIAEFRQREGRHPSRWERAAMTREAAADTRRPKTGISAVAVRERWRAEALDAGWTAEDLTEQLTTPALERVGTSPVTIDEVLDQLSASGSAWTRADVLRAVCDVAASDRDVDGYRWGAALAKLTDAVLDRCVDLDPEVDGRRRRGDGRSVWLEPTAPHWTSPAILAEEEHILTWALDTQLDPPTHGTIERNRLDVLQADAAGAVAGTDRLVVVVGPAGTGKTTMLRAAVHGLERQCRPVLGVAPTAKAAHVLHDETGMATDTVAKLLYDHDRGRADRFRLPAGATLVVDEAGMLGTSSLRRLIGLADEHRWRLVLVGDPRQLQAVGRGGMFTELCRTVRTQELVLIHRFTHPWEANASLLLRAGHPDALDPYLDHDRVHPGTLEDHLDHIAHQWVHLHRAGCSVTVTASSNEHVDTLNAAIQQARLRASELDAGQYASIGGGEHAHVGYVVVTRRNDRHLVTSGGEIVRNRERWAVDTIHDDGSLTLRRDRHTVTLPAHYTDDHVRLGYAATEHGHQGDTVDVGIALISLATTHPGLYVATTRGRNENHLHVITETAELTQAREVLDDVLHHDRADLPAVTRRRDLATVSARSRPRDPIPNWVEPWRQRIVNERAQVELVVANDRARQEAASEELAQLQPALQAARQAWEPHAERIQPLQARLHGELSSAMWSTHHEAATAGPGRRRLAQRRAERADQAVADLHIVIAGIRHQGSDAAQRLDSLEARRRDLKALADPGRGPSAAERQRHHLDHLIHAVDIYCRWLGGSGPPTDELEQAVAILDAVAARARPYLADPTQIDRHDWTEFLTPGRDALRPDRPIDHQPTRELDLGR